MEQPEELAIAYCENILECVDRIEQAQREFLKDFPSEKYQKYFSLAFVQTMKESPNTVPERFALLTLAGVLKVMDGQQAKILCENFRTSNEIFMKCSLTEAVAEIERAVADMYWKQLEICASDAFEFLKTANQRVPQVLASERKNSAEEVYEIVESCIFFIRKGYESRRQKFTDTKHFQYFAYYLSLLHAYGLQTSEVSAYLFEKLVKKIGADDPGRRSAMEYKYCKALVTFDELFKRQLLEDAIVCCLSYIEKGRAVLKYQGDSNVQLGLQATQILQSAISHS